MPRKAALDLEELHHQPEAQPRRPVFAGQQLQVGVDQRPRRDQIIQFPLTAHGTTLAERASSTDPPPTQRRYAARRHRGDDTPHGGRPCAGGYGTRLRSWCASTSTRPATSARSSNVVLGTDHDDVALARDYRGQFLVYDEAMQRIETYEETEGHAIKIAEHREWPDRLDWEDGPDALRYPGLYNVNEPDDAEDDLEALDLEEHDDPPPTATTRQRSAGMT